MFEPDWLQAKTELTGGHEAVMAELALLLCPSRMSKFASFSTALAVAIGHPTLEHSTVDDLQGLSPQSQSPLTPVSPEDHKFESVLAGTAAGMNTWPERCFFFSKHAALVAVARLHCPSSQSIKIKCTRAGRI